MNAVTSISGLAAKPQIVDQQAWDAARDELLLVEKEVTRAEDAAAALRRRMPMVRFRSDYVFDSPDGPRTLLDLFEGRLQLLQYQFMDAGPDSFCPGCTWFTDGVPPTGLKRLAELDASWATVSDMPLEQMTGYWLERGWTVPYFSSRGTGFSSDLGVGGGFMLSVFLRDGDQVYRTYDTGSRGVDHLVFANLMQDLLPFGRQQAWEDSPAGWPQYPTYEPRPTG